MKYLLLVVLALANITAMKIESAAPAPRNSLAPSAAKARLKLTTSIVRERSCFPAHLGFELRFTFRNIGNEPVIVDKRSIITRTLISRSLTALASKKYEQVIRSDQWGLYFAVDPSDMSNLVIIQPGEGFDLETGQTRVSLHVRKGRRESKGNLPPGSYFLQVEVATWTYLQDPTTYKKTWSEKGYLWSEGLTSEPMSFVVEQNRPIEKCS
jgi:hypothetical protein